MWMFVAGFIAGVFATIMWACAVNSAEEHFNKKGDK